MTFKKSEAVAVSTITQKDIPNEIEKMESILKELTSSVDNEVSTNVKYGNVQINNVTTVKELLEISASIHSRAAAFDKEVKRYKLETKIDEFSCHEKSKKEWVKIIEKAIFELINKVQISNIETAIEKLSNHLSEETKLQKSLNDIMKLANQTIK